MHTTTLDEIHRDPAILDRAIAQHEPLEIFQAGRLAARMVPENAPPAAAGAAKPWSEIWNAEEHRARVRAIWGDRFFSEAEVQEMRDAEDGVIE
jgi:hypothetical protein